MAYNEMFDPLPDEEQALVAALGGEPPPPDPSPLLTPAALSPEEQAFLKQLLLSNVPPDPRAAMPVEMPVQQPMFHSTNARDESGAPIVLPQQSPLTRMLSGGGVPPDTALDAAVARGRARGTEPGPPAMRAPSMREQIDAGSQAFVEGAAEQPLGQVLDALGISNFSGTSAQGRGEEPMPEVAGMMPDVPGAGIGKKLTKKAAAAAERKFLEGLFPVLDQYSKKKGYLKGADILATLQAHAGVSPEALARAQKLADKGKKMKPAEVVDTLMGVKHDRGRVLMDMKGRKLPKKHLPGAPIWVGTPADEDAALENYLQLMEEGLPGRNFYRDSGRAIFQATGENPEMAYKAARAASATSPTTSVGANSGFMLKGHGQGVAGEPVSTGRFPKNMSPPITETYAGTLADLGPKRDPFARQIAMGGGFATPEQMTDRAVHDIWEGESFLFIEPDGTPMRRGFTEAEHAWMDKMSDRAIAEANRRQIGGFTDWDAGTTQAATWTGSKIRAGDIKPGDAAKSFADYMPRNVMQMGRENVPGSTMRHIPEYSDPNTPQWVKDLYDASIRDIHYDAQGRDRGALDKGMMSVGSFEGPGVFTDQAGNVGVNPGTQAKNLVGTRGSGPTREVDPANMAMAQLNEAEWALAGGQDAMAGTMLEEGALEKQRDMFDLASPTGKLAVGDPIFSHPDIQAALKAKQIALIPTEDGARVKNIGMPEKDFATLAKQLGKQTQSELAQGKDLGFYFEPEKNWDTPEGAVGQEFARKIRDQIAKGKEIFNQGGAPARMKARFDLDERMKNEFGWTLNDTLQELRLAISQRGFDGINDVAKKLGVPLAMLVMALQLEESPEQPLAQPQG